MKERKATFFLICMCSCVIVFLSAVIIIILSYIITYRYHFETYEQILQSFYDNVLIHSCETVINFIMGLAIIPATIGIFFFLHYKTIGIFKKLLFLPIISSLIGAFFIIGLYVIKSTLIFNVAPTYIEAIDKEPILEQFTRIQTISNILSLVTYILLYTTGAGIFGVIALRTSSTKGVNSWIAILCGVFALGKIGYFIDNEIAAFLIFLASIGSILYFFWIASNFFILRDYRKQLSIGFMDEGNSYSEELTHEI